MRRHPRLPLYLLPFVGWACHPPQDIGAPTLTTAAAQVCTGKRMIEPDSGAIRTDRCSYRVEQDRVTIVATFTNRTTDTVHILAINDTPGRWYLDRWTGGPWTQAFHFAPLLEADSPTVVPPRTTHIDTLRIPFPFGWPPTEGDTTGVFRLRYNIHRGWRLNGESNAPVKGPLLPAAERVSNSFTVTRRP